MNRFRQPPVSSMSMTPYNEGDGVVFMMSEEPRKPNIIRGSGVKVAKALQPIPPPTTESLQDESPQIVEEYIKMEPSHSPDSNEIVFTHSEIESPDTMIATFAEHLQNFEGAQQFENPPENVIPAGEDETSFQQNVLIEPKIENATDDQIVQAAIQTPEGNFIVYMKGDEIISAHAVNAATEGQQEMEIVEEQEGQEAQESITSEQGANEGQVENSPEVIEVQQPGDMNMNYMLYQLPTGETILVQGGYTSDNQFVLSGTQEPIQFTTSSVQIQSDIPIPSGVKGGQSRKRSGGELQVKGPSPPKKTYARKPKNICPAPHPPQSSITTSENSGSSALRGVYAGQSGSGTNMLIKEENVEQIEVTDIKPKPFRFDIPEAETEGFVGDNFLSLVIENFQTQIESQSGDVDQKPVLPIVSTSADGGAIVKLENGDFGTVSMEQCPKCSFKASGVKSISQHVARNHPDDILFTCNHCEKMFTYAFQLTSHKKIHHGISKDQALVCDACGAQFQIESSLFFHLRTCHLKRMKDSEAVGPVEMILPEILPAVPGQERVITVTKSTNRRKQTVYSRDKEFPCEEDACFKWFGDKFGLLRHKINVHLTDPPFPCSICERAFDSKEALLSHVASHEDGIARPFECDKCQKAFKMESHLVGHMRAHIQKNTFVSAKSREEHLLKHPEKLMELVKMSYRNKSKTEGNPSEIFCRICDDMFPNQAAFDKHRAKPCGADAELPKPPKPTATVESKATTSTGHLLFDSIADWRKHNDSTVSTSTGSAQVVFGVRPNRDVSEVQNDFKSLSFKLLKPIRKISNKKKSEEENIKIADDCKDNDLVPDVSLSSQEKSDPVPPIPKEPAVVISPSNLEIKAKRIPKVEEETDTSEQTLSNDSITTIVNRMSSKMTTRAGVKCVKTEVVKEQPVKKRKEIIIVQTLPLEKTAETISVPETRDLRSRNLKSSATRQQTETGEQEAVTNPIENQPVNIEALEEDVDTGKVGKSFVRIFQKVKRQQETHPGAIETLNAPKTRRCK